MENIFTADNEVLLNSCLDEQMFAKTKFSSLMYGEGWTAEQDGNGNYSVFKKWAFSGTKTIDGTVYFSGSGFCGKSIASLSESSTEAEMRDILTAVCQSYTYAQKQGIILPCTGPFSVLYDGKKLLFAPQNTFDKCCANLGKEKYMLMQDPWRDAALSGKKAVNFTRAVYSYFALTKSLPYPPGTETDKSISIAYRNFLPLEFCINGINRDLAAAVDNALCSKSDKTEFPLKMLEAELSGTSRRQKIFSDVLFEKKVLAYRRKQQKRIRMRRIFNRWHTAALTGTSFLLILAIFIANAVIENGRKPVVTGLDSARTVEIFYSGIHKMDTDYMLAAAKDCPQAQGYISRIPQIYVTSQMRAAYNFESGMSTPENWLFFEPDSTRAYSHTIYGITNFTIDGEPSTLNLTAPSKNSRHTTPPRTADGKRPDNFSRANHTVRYFLVHTVDNMIEIEQFTTVVYLRFIKDRWQIIKLDETSSKETESLLPISLDMKSELEKNGTDEIQAAENLRTKYPWLPTRQSMAEEKTRLDKTGY